MPEVRELGHDECLDRLRSRAVGRIAVTDQALPVIVPVNYLLLGNTLVFRSEPGGLLARACNETVVAFEVDELALDGSSGWSVLVVGVAGPLDEGEMLRVAARGLASAARPESQHFVGIRAGRLTGREVGPSPCRLVGAGRPSG